MLSFVGRPSAHYSSKSPPMFHLAAGVLLRSILASRKQNRKAGIIDQTATARQGKNSASHQLRT